MNASLLNDLGKAQLIEPEINSSERAVCGLLLSSSHSYLLACPGQKSTLKGDGKRVGQDGGQAGSCGKLKLQTKAYL